MDYSKPKVLIDLDEYNELKIVNSSVNTLPQLGQWISIDQDFPKTPTEVLCCSVNNNICIIRIHTDGDICLAKGNITHWMPLPNPPSNAK